MSSEQKYRVGDLVKVKRPSLREHGMEGSVTYSDPTINWYAVDFKVGPPWRGRFRGGDLVPLSGEGE